MQGDTGFCMVFSLRTDYTTASIFVKYTHFPIQPFFDIEISKTIFLSVHQINGIDLECLGQGHKEWRNREP